MMTSLSKVNLPLELIVFKEQVLLKSLEQASWGHFLTKVGRSNMQIPDFERNVVQAIIKKYYDCFFPSF
jgi:hypothetical protein